MALVTEYLSTKRSLVALTASLVPPVTTVVAAKGAGASTEVAVGAGVVTWIAALRPSINWQWGRHLDSLARATQH